MFVILITMCAKIGALAKQNGKQSLIADFFSQSKPFRFRREEIVLRPDYINPGVNYLEKGNVKVYSITEDGYENIHLIFKPGEIFPLLWVFRGVNREVYYEALDEVVIRRVTKEAFLDFLKENPDALLELIDEILTVSNVYVSRIQDLEHMKSYPRLISRLISLSERFGKRSGGKIIIDVPLTHHDISDSINMTRETTSREMEELIRKKLISYKKRIITIRDMAKLKKELTLHGKREAL